MPIAKVRLPDGRIGRFNVPEGTTPEQVVSFAKAQSIGDGEPKTQPEKPSFFGSSVLEPLATLASGTVAEPIAGIAGIAQAVNPFAETGAGAKAVEATREALTFQPRTEAGQESLETVGGLLEPVGKALQTAESFLGDTAFDLTESPTIAAAAATIPTALLEVLGVASAKGALKTGAKAKLAKLTGKKAVKKAIVESAPEIQTLKKVASGIYDELDNSGASITPKSYDRLIDKIDTVTKEAGIDVGTTKGATAAMNRLKSEKGDFKSLKQMDTLRQVARDAADKLKPADTRISGIILDEIDGFLDDLSFGPKYKVARELWGRAKRSELINEAFDNARLAAAGTEKGLAAEFKRLLKNQKTKKLFTPDERLVMEKVVKSPTAIRVVQVIGKFGFSEKQAAKFLAGAAGGFAVGGPVGLFVVPTIGEVSKAFGKRLVKNNSRFAESVIRAGRNAEKITKAYLANTPKASRKASELSELLLRNTIPLDNALSSSSKLVREAAEIAKGRRIVLAASAGAGGLAGGVKSLQDMGEFQSEDQKSKLSFFESLLRGRNKSRGPQRQQLEEKREPRLTNALKNFNIANQ